MSKIGRRKFLKDFTAGTLTATMAPAITFSQTPPKTKTVQKGQMIYRRLGRTDMYVSEISLGGSPVPDWAILLQIIERGVNYLDTSHSYMNGNSERTIGKLFKEIGRDKVQVGTKFHLGTNWNEQTILRTVEGSLRRLGTDTIDVLLVHGISDENHLTDERVLSAFEKMKQDGKFRFKGVSCHANHQNVIKRAVECGHYDMVQLGYNVFDIEDKQEEIEVYEDYLEACGVKHLLSQAAAKDVGVIAMKTLKIGGRRQNLEKYQINGTTIYQSMLKWALENPYVSSVVIEMLNYQEMEEDLSVVGVPLSKAERKNLFRFVAENSRDYCHMCSRCQRNCPSGIQTTSIQRYLAYHEAYDKKTRAAQAYSRLQPRQTVLSCQDCGRCETNCPYGVAVRQRIQDAHKLLA